MRARRSVACGAFQIIRELCIETGRKVLVAQLQTLLVEVCNEFLVGWNETRINFMVAALRHVVTKLAVPSQCEVKELANLEMREVVSFVTWKCSRVSFNLPEPLSAS